MFYSFAQSSARCLASPQHGIEALTSPGLRAGLLESVRLESAQSIPELTNLEQQAMSGERGLEHPGSGLHPGLVLARRAQESATQGSINQAQSAIQAQVTEAGPLIAQDAAERAGENQCTCNPYQCRAQPYSNRSIS